MEILLVRHGETEADLLNVHEGAADFTLTEQGLAQARLMANYVKDRFPPETIYASTLKRAVETAKILENLLKVPVTYRKALKERDNGELAGQPIKGNALTWMLPPYQKLGKTGETAIEFRARVHSELLTIIEESSGCSRIAIVSHGGVTSKLIESYLSLPLVQTHWFHTDYTGITMLRYSKDNRVVVFTNSTEHLRLMAER